MKDKKSDEFFEQIGFAKDTGTFIKSIGSIGRFRKTILNPSKSVEHKKFRYKDAKIFNFYNIPFF
jgi:hypothetical protein